VDIKDMSTSQRQRYFETEKENRVKQLGKHQSRKLIGQVRMLVVALNYEGTDAPLTCIIDAKRITEAAQKAGVSDITSLYDNGETKGFPSHEEVSQAIMDVGGRCGPGDYFVFYYSGHGGSQPDEEAPTGLRCTLNLRTRDGGSEEDMWDHELASLVSGHLHEETKVLMMCDACHSGGIMDVDSSGVWGKRKVAVISGCMENQLSEDSGDGGVMTNALLKVIRRKSVNQLRLHRGCSVQYVFNRVVGEMPEQEEEEEEEEEEEGWGEEDEWDEAECEEDDEEEVHARIAKLREAFRQFDVDDSGTLSADELAQLLTRGTSSGTPLSAEDAQEIIDDFDTDGDGVLSLDELARAWVEITGGDEEVEEHEVVPGQHVTLSWPGGCDPSKFPFPF